jgi:hypothetical protein
MMNFSRNAPPLFAGPSIERLAGQYSPAQLEPGD